MCVEPNWDSCVKDTWEPGYRFPKILEHFLKIIRRSYERFLSISRNFQMNSENFRFPINSQSWQPGKTANVSRGRHLSSRKTTWNDGSSGDLAKRRLFSQAKTRSLNFQLSDWFTTHRLSANNPAFFLIRTLGALSSAAAFKIFLRDAKVLSKNMTKKKTATITEVEKLLKQIIPLALVGH